MLTDREQLRLLYLDDLRRLVAYGEKTRPRVRFVERAWSKIKSVTDTECIDISKYKDVWVWSDIHFYHTNIIKYCDRPFDSVEEMNQTLIENHNNLVGPNDLVIWVGDVSFKNVCDTNALLRQLNGDRILIAGNHDLDKKRRHVRALDFNEIHLLYTIDDGVAPIVFTHFTMDNAPLPWINVHGHVHNQPYDVEHSLQHINVSVEVIDYKPMHLTELRRIARERLDDINK